MDLAAFQTYEDRLYRLLRGLPYGFDIDVDLLGDGDDTLVVIVVTWNTRSFVKGEKINDAVADVLISNPPEAGLEPDEEESRGGEGRSPHAWSYTVVWRLPG